MTRNAERLIIVRMTTTSTERQTTLTDRVAEEIRAVMGRRRVSGAQLARLLGVSQMWVSYRLSGKQPIDLNDLERIAQVLDVSVAALLPAGAAATVQTGTGVTVVYERPLVGRSPADTRPPGRPRSGATHRPQLIGLMDRIISWVTGPGLLAVA